MAKKRDKKRPEEYPAETTIGGTPREDINLGEEAQAPMAPVTGNVTDQVTQAWTGLLAMATQQGASRRDIAVMTLLTAGSILDITGVNLWPLGQDLPMDEAQGFAHYQAALGGVHKALQALGVDRPFQSLPGTQEGPREAQG